MEKGYGDELVICEKTLKQGKGRTYIGLDGHRARPAWGWTGIELDGVQLDQVQCATS